MIRVYLCTYNGERYIGEQLQSLVRQTCQDFDVLLSDDGSTDGTIRIAEDYAGRIGKGIVCRKGPQRGSAANFLTSLAEDTETRRYYAFCDQDDIWLEGKLERAAEWFGSILEDRPALYGARVCVVDRDNNEQGISTRPLRPLAFANALVQNYASGNTMVFNQAAHSLIRQSLEGIDPAAIPMHDWWAYLMVSGAGGVVHCDDYVSLRYRQHGENVVGAKASRFKALFGADALDWSERNVKALKQQAALLTDENRDFLAKFAAARVAPLPARIGYALRKNGVYRQTWVSQIGILLQFIFKRV